MVSVFVSPARPRPSLSAWRLLLLLLLLLQRERVGCLCLSKSKQEIISTLAPLVLALHCVHLVHRLRTPVMRVREAR